jgi:hypothetical protein
MKVMQRKLSLDVFDYSGHALCNLYDSSTDLDGQAYEVIVHTERNGFKELRFNLPSVCDEERNYRLDFLISDYRIRFREEKNNNVEIDWFLISESRVTHNNFSTNYEIRAGHISQLLNTKNLSLEFSDDEGNNTGTIKQIAQTILEGTGWHLGKVAEFKEEEKYSPTPVEKVRSFNASAKTGAFKMMSDLCEMFDAKPIYHGEGTYTEDGVEKIGRTVDIIPMNPFSEKLDEGTIPQDLNKDKVIELYYDKNVSNITRTLNTDNLVTVFYAYGSYGDLNGMASLQTAEHAEIVFGQLPAGKYHFEHKNANYYFETNIQTNSLKWSSLDPTSISYVFDGTNLFKVDKTPYDQYATITGNVSYVKNQVPYICDFSYYDKIGLLSDEMKYKIAQVQTELPQKHIAAQEASIDLSKIKEQLSQTASAGNGFLKLDISGSDDTTGYVTLTIDKSNYEDGVIFRSDYDEARRNYFSWNCASGIKLNGEAIAGKGAVVYIVHQDDKEDPEQKEHTTWEKSYVKALGNGTDNYYRDSLGNIYELHEEKHYDRKEYSPTYPDDTYFPITGEPNYIYVADNTTQSYIWINDDYVEIQASGYFYGLNEFPEPTTITLWSTQSTWHDGDQVYLFSADSIAGVFGPREDAIMSNRKSIEETIKVSTETHPLYFIKDNESLPGIDACENGYGWVYRIYSDTFAFGKLYFVWGKAGEVDWSEVYVSNNDDNPEKLTPQYKYYYSLKRMMLYREEDGIYRAIKDTVDEQKINEGFSAVIDGCINQEALSKGVCERYNYSGSEIELPIGNYAFKNEYNNYWLFTTDRVINDHSLLYYIPADKIVWQDNDENHILKSVERSFRHLDFPKIDELYDTTFVKSGYENETFLPEGNLYVSNNIYVHDNINYEFILPANAIVVCLSQYQKVLGEFTTSPFTTPNHTTHVRIVSPTEIQSSNYFRVLNYDKVFFSGNNMYTILDSTGAGERLGMTYLMDKFIDLAHQAYEVKLPLLQSKQQEITDMNLDLANTLGDIYREGYWQENSYVEGDEAKLYFDSLDNLKEVSHPQPEYEITFLDLHEADENDNDRIEIPYPDVDIEYAVHLVDMDIDTNRWAYIDSIDKCYDQSWKTQIDVNTRLSLIGQQSFTDVLSKIAEVANETKAKQTIYERADSIGSSGKFAADKLEGLIQTNKIYLMGGTSNWYTDPKGNIIFEAADGNSAVMITGRGIAISASRDQYGDWDWRTALSGEGFNADTIATGQFSAKHILAGTITTDKLSSNVGQELEIGSNKALTLYATADGTRPSGSLKTTDAVIEIKAGDESTTPVTPAQINIGSGGELNLSAADLNINAGSSLVMSSDAIMDIAAQGKITINSGSTVDIKSGGKFLVDSTNFKIVQDPLDSSKYNVTVVGNITTTGGTIAGYTISQNDSDPLNIIDFMKCGSVVSIDSQLPGVYLGTNGLNLGGKFVYKLSDTSYQNQPSLSVKANYVWIGDTPSGEDPSTYFELSNGNLTLNAAANINLTASGAIDISSGNSIVITTDGSISIGKTGQLFEISAAQKTVSDLFHAYISHGGRTYYDEVSSNISRYSVYLGADGISLGQHFEGYDQDNNPVYSIPFSVDNEGYLIANNAFVRGNITALTGYIANWDIIGNRLSSGSGTDYVALDSTESRNEYDQVVPTWRIWAGNETASVAPFSIKSDGSLFSVKGNIAGWQITDSKLYRKTVDGNNYSDYVGISPEEYAFWAGWTHTETVSEMIETTPFYVKKNGDLHCENADITGIIRASELYINNKLADITLDGNGHINMSSLSTITIGTSTSGVQVTDSGITVRSGGSIDLSAAGSVNLGTISMSDVSGLSDALSKKYTTQSNISISGSGITMSSGTLSLTGSNSISMTGGSITLTGGGNITLTGGNVSLNGGSLSCGQWYFRNDGIRKFYNQGDVTDNITIQGGGSYSGRLEFYTYSKGGQSAIAEGISVIFAPSSYRTGDQHLDGETSSIHFGQNNFGEIGTPWSKLYEVHSKYVYCTTLTQDSSRKFKTKIKDLPNTDKIIDKFRPIKYEYKDELGQIRFGFIAEEVAEFCPSLCGTNNESLNYTDIIPILVKEVQNLRKRIKVLEGD